MRTCPPSLNVALSCGPNMHILLPENEPAGHWLSAPEPAASPARSLHMLQESGSRPCASSAALQARPYAAKHPASHEATSRLLPITYRTDADSCSVASIYARLLLQRSSLSSMRMKKTMRIMTRSMFTQQHALRAGCLDCCGSSCFELSTGPRRCYSQMQAGHKQCTGRLLTWGKDGANIQPAELVTQQKTGHGQQVHSAQAPPHLTSHILQPEGRLVLLCSSTDCPAC